MTVPNNSPDLLAMLVGVIQGECSPLILADWLDERGDERAEEIRTIWNALNDGGEGTIAAMDDIFSHFEIQECDCFRLDAGPQPGCDACKQLGWVMNKVPLR